MGFLGFGFQASGLVGFRCLGFGEGRGGGGGVSQIPNFGLGGLRGGGGVLPAGQLVNRLCLLEMAALGPKARLEGLGAKVNSRKHESFFILEPR